MLSWCSEDDRISYWCGKAHTFGGISVLRIEPDFRTCELSSTAFLFPHVILKLMKLLNEKNETWDCEGVERPSDPGVVGIYRLDRICAVEVKVKVPVLPQEGCQEPGSFGSLKAELEV